MATEGVFLGMAEPRVSVRTAQDTKGYECHLDCEVILADGKKGDLYSLKPGDTVQLTGQPVTQITVVPDKAPK